MKVFISADIEGITTTTTHEECNPTSPLYPRHAEQMTKEVLAVVEGAFKAGASEVVIKDAHGPAMNIDPTQMPENVILQRGWTGHPYMMADGVDNTFDAAMFVGYHSAAGKPGNPLSHTFSGKAAYIKLNNRFASEFMIYSWACALEGVPSVFLSGDKMLCEDEAELHPNLVSVATKDGLGAITRNYSTITTLKNLKEKSEQALRQDLSNAKIILPDSFELEVFFKDQTHAEKVSHYPGAIKASSNIIIYKSTQYIDVLRAVSWIL